MELKESALARSIEKLMPGQTHDEALGHLLLTEARRKLVKYRTANQHFERKYHVSFEKFRQMILDSQPSDEHEQDYFDWELAVTGIEEMEAEIRYLEGVV